jgi:hypothetical protein
LGLVTIVIDLRIDQKKKEALVINFFGSSYILLDES